MNRDIATKVTPIYNTYLLVTASVFAYFIVMEENKCYAKDGKAFGVQYEDSEDISRIFYVLSNLGMVISLVQVLLYYLQTKDDMFQIMRPYVIIVNLGALVWFIAL